VTDGNDLMNAAIRSAARPAPPDLNDHHAVNAVIRRAAGVSTPAPGLPAPPPPDAEPAAFNRWADQASDAGMDRAELARWGTVWVTARRQHLADRRGQR
jgi:hypothetical protein